MTFTHSMAFDVNSTEEPYAGKPHVRFREGRKSSHLFLNKRGTLDLPPQKAIFGCRAFASIGGWDFSVLLFQNGGCLAELTSGTMSQVSVGGTSDSSDEPALLGGFDYKGNLFLGVYGEILLAISYEGYRLAPDRTNLSMVLGADYSLADLFFCTVEYQRNFGQGPQPGQFQADRSLFASLVWKPDDWTSANSPLIFTPRNQAWQGLLSLNRVLLRRTSLMVYTTASRGDVRTDEPLGAYTPMVLALGLTLEVAF